MHSENAATDEDQRVEDVKYLSSWHIENTSYYALPLNSHTIGCPMNGSKSLL